MFVFCADGRCFHITSTPSLRVFYSGHVCSTYSSIFVPTGGGTNTEFWLKKAKVEIKNVRGSLQRIADLK